MDIRINAKILCQLLCSFIWADTKIPCRKVNDISRSLTTEAMIMVIIKFHTRSPVIVEWTTAHTISLYPKSVSLCSLFGCDGCLHSFKNTHTLDSSLNFLDDFFICMNIRKKIAPPEKSVIRARNKKIALKSCKNARNQSVGVQERWIDIVPKM